MLEVQRGKKGCYSNCTTISTPKHVDQKILWDCTAWFWKPDDSLPALSHPPAVNSRLYLKK